MPATFTSFLKLGAALVVCAFAECAALTHAASLVVAVDARVEEFSGGARLVFDLSGTVEAYAFVLADPDRVVIDLPEVNFQINPPAARHSTGRSVKPSLIQTYRFGALGAGRSRIVIDLTGPARIIRADSQKIGQGDPSRLVIELKPTDRASFAAAAQAGARTPAPKLQPATPELPAKPAASESRPLIVLDPGHGGIDAGASSGTSAIEKSIVFDFARSLAQRLEAGGHYRVILTRNSDVFVSLADRVQVARDAHAALFVSIHADTLAGATEVQGATIYTLAEKATDAEAGRIADKENQSDSVAGVVSGDDTGDVNDILFELTRRETRAYSHLFARTLVGVWQGEGRLNKNPQRAAGFKVLRAPDVPSVLVELGYLSSQRDVADLSSQAWREKTAETITRSINGFFASRSADAPVETGALRVQDNPAPANPLAVLAQPVPAVAKK